MPTTAHILALAAALALLPGCQRALVQHPLRTDTHPADADSELQFWDDLALRPAASTDEALHALFLFADGADLSLTHLSRVTTARSRGWVGPLWEYPPHATARRGTIARAIVQICDIPGGVILHAAGNSERYALRELVYLGIFPDSTPAQAISGRELIGVINKAQDYRRLATARHAAAPP